MPPHGTDMDRKLIHLDAQSLLDTRDYPFIVIDMDYNIIAANKSYCDAYNVAAEDVIGAKCYQVSHQCDAPCHTQGEDCPIRAISEDQPVHESQHVHHGRNGNEQVQIRGFLIRDTEGNRYLGEEIILAAPGTGAANEDDSAGTPQVLVSIGQPGPDDGSVGAIELDGSIESVEYNHIRHLLETHHGHRRKVAEILKISERTLYRKLNKYNLTRTGKDDD